MKAIRFKISSTKQESSVIDPSQQSGYQASESDFRVPRWRLKLISLEAEVFRGVVAAVVAEYCDMWAY